MIFIHLQNCADKTTIQFENISVTAKEPSSPRWPQICLWSQICSNFLVSPPAPGDHEFVSGLKRFAFSGHSCKWMLSISVISLHHFCLFDHTFRTSFAMVVYSTDWLLSISAMCSHFALMGIKHPVSLIKHPVSTTSYSLQGTCTVTCTCLLSQTISVHTSPTSNRLFLFSVEGCLWAGNQCLWEQPQPIADGRRYINAPAPPVLEDPRGALCTDSLPRGTQLSWSTEVLGLTADPTLALLPSGSHFHTLLPAFFFPPK